MFETAEVTAAPEAPDSAPKSKQDLRPLWFWAIAIALLCLGLALRLSNLLGGRGLWLDELYLAPNVLDRGFVELASPLINQQVAPLGFLAASKLATLLPVDAEIGLRLFPFLAEASGVALFLALMLRAGASRTAAVIGLACVCLLNPFVRHGPEFKQYGTEFFVTVLAALIALTVLQRPTLGRRIGLAAAGALACLLSLTAPFALATGGILLFFNDLRARDWAATAGTAATGALWIGVFALGAMAILNTGTQDEMQGTFWSWAFLPLPPSPYTVEWLIRRLFDLFRETSGFHDVGGLAVLFAALGMAVFWRDRRWVVLALLLGPLAFAFFASAAQLYPFHGRLLHFATPGLVALVAVGTAALAERLASGRGRAAVTVLLALLLVVPGARATVENAARTTPPFEREGVERVIAQVLRQREAGDLIYLHAKAVAPALRHSERTGTPLDPYMIGRDPIAGPAHFLQDVEALAARGGRVWVVIGAGWLGTGTADIADWITDNLLVQFAQPGAEIRSVEARAVLLDFGPGGTDGPRLITGDPGPYRPDQFGDFPQP
ncbi:MAG: hypothetical protein AAF882_17015 [Pseudomonadota bacterium]